MTRFKRLVCLANSRKGGQRCIAGMVVDSQQWIRPVSARKNHEISKQERQYKDGSDPRVLDIIDVPLLHRRPSSYQSENWLLDPRHHWKRAGRAEWNHLLTMEQHPSTLWTNGYSTSGRLNDRIPIEEAATLPDSLKLVRVSRVTLRPHSPHASSDAAKRTMDAVFRHAGHLYIMPVTDPEYELAYRNKPGKVHELGESFLTVSLGEEFKGYSYKLAAAIIERTKIEAGSET
ncbi:dual OB domain-containing protein [Streptomyces chrestomyceticus]|uniref:dual OB domain-containing protein n=1 Tax=Streptomyces chrestomyceticus TaxID=68185 RepID=UPI0033ECE171